MLPVFTRRDTSPKWSAFFLEPLALHYLEQSYSTKVEAVDEKLRVAFQVADELANWQKIEIESNAVLRKAPPPLRELRRTSRTVKRRKSSSQPAR